MAKNRFNPLEDPPTASSSHEDEIVISSSSEEEGHDPTKTTSTKTLKTTPFAAPGSDDSETEQSPNQEIGKAISVSTEKEGSDSPAVNSEKKRPNEGTSRGMHVKRAKTVSGNDDKKSGEDKKRTYFQRLWSEEDEISLLQGMVDFKAETGTSPFDDMNGFYDTVKNYISFGVSKTQVSDKIRGFKRKYFGKQQKNKVLESSHDKKCLGLTKYIWESNGMALESPLESKKNLDDSMVQGEEDRMVALDSAVKSRGKAKKVESLKHNAEKVEEDKQVTINWFEKSFLVGSIASLGVDEYSVMQKWSKVPMETQKRIEDKFKLVKAKEIELLAQKIDILKEVTSVISEAI